MTAIVILFIMAGLLVYLAKPAPGVNSIFEFINVDNIFNLKKRDDFNGLDKDLKYPRRLRFSIVSYSEPDKIFKKGGAIKQYFESSMSLEVKIVVLRDYSSLIDLLKVGQVEVVWAAPLIYKTVKDTINYNLLLKTMEGDSPFYEGAIVVRKDSGIKTIEDLKGKKMAFVDEASTSGFFLQNKIINDHGYSTLSFFSAFEFVGSHDRALKLLYDKRFDAASIGLLALNVAGVDTAELEVLAKTPKIPNAPILVNNNLDPSTRAKIYDLLISPLNHPGGKEFINTLNEIDKFSAFIKADTSEYEF
jgi:phosphonate transport system substrate-binding protein